MHGRWAVAVDLGIPRHEEVRSKVSICWDNCDFRCWKVKWLKKVGKLVLIRANIWHLLWRITGIDGRDDSEIF